MKNIFSAQDGVVNTTSKGIFDCVTPSDAAYLDSYSPN